jgi:hypothetical protein
MTITSDIVEAFLSAVTQNRSVRVEIKGFKTGHFLEPKTALLGLVTARSEGHVECPESEPANEDIVYPLAVTELADSVARHVQGTRHPQALGHTKRLRHSLDIRTKSRSSFGPVGVRG